jgi:lysophospholipase L1-like esterase
MTQASRRPRSLFAPLVVIALITFGMIAFCEVAARVARWSAVTPVSDSGNAFLYGLGGYGDLAPNQNRVITLLADRPYRLQTNSVGLRNTAELDDNAFRILVVGDSFTFGAYVHNAEAWPARLEEHLNQRYPQDFQVLNAGIPGYTLQDELAYLRDKGLALAPDLVVIGVYTNDIFDYDGRIRAVLSRDAVLASARPLPVDTTLSGWMAQNSALYGTLREISLARDDQRVASALEPFAVQFGDMQAVYYDITFLHPEHHAEYWEGYRQDFEATLALLRENGVPFVIVLFPDLAQFPAEGGLPTAPQDFLAGLTADHDVPYLDLLPILRESGDPQSLYLVYYNDDVQVNLNAPDAAVQAYTGDGHPSPYGHLVASRTLAEWLTAQGLLPSGR